MAYRTDSVLTAQAGDREHAPAQRTAPFHHEPGFYEPAGLWLFGNARLLEQSLAHVQAATGPPDHRPDALEAIEQEAERLVLDGSVLVCGVHNPAHQRAAIVPLRWGSPRIIVVSGGFKHHLGELLQDEPFPAARLWRYTWDPLTDLAISRRAPEKKPTYALHNPAVDRLIARLACGERVGLLSPLNAGRLFLT